MKITNVHLTLFAWDDIPATTYGRHTGKFSGASQLGSSLMPTSAMSTQTFHFPALESTCQRTPGTSAWARRWGMMFSSSSLAFSWLPNSSQARRLPGGEVRWREIGHLWEDTRKRFSLARLCWSRQRPQGLCQQQSAL